VLLEKENVLINSCLNFKKEGTLINHKFKNYDGSYKGPVPYIGCWGNGGYQYEADATKSY
jgi:hypothetical protein